MSAWEYLVQTCACRRHNSLRNALNECGRAGWELVHMFPTGRETEQTLVFKRPADRPEAQP